MLKCATAPMFCSPGVWFQAFRWHTQRKSPAPVHEPRKRIICYNFGYDLTSWRSEVRALLIPPAFLGNLVRKITRIFICPGQ